MSVEAVPNWAVKAMRLDPSFLPQEISCTIHDDQEDEVRLKLGTRGVRMHRILDHAQLPVTVVLPPKAFLGVAARAIDDSKGTITITLELLHCDPELSVPLLVAGDLDDVAVDWKAWSEAYCLPMLLVEADGSIHQLDDSGRMRRSRQPLKRGKRLGAGNSHPVCRAHQRGGALGLRLVIDGREAIAR